MAAPTAAQCHAMTSYFVKEYKRIHKADPNVNRNVAKQGFLGMLMDMSSEQVKTLIDFFFTMPPVATGSHSINWFLYNYDKVKDALVEAEDDKDHRRKLMRESAERARKWIESGKSGISSN